MNLMFMGLMYPNDIYNTVSQNCKTGMQTQLDNFQKLLIKGMKKNAFLKHISIIDALPVGSFPRHYKRIFVKTYKKINYVCPWFINLPLIKQKMREVSAKKYLLKWLKDSKNNRYVLLYSLYLPYMKAIVELKKDFPDLKAGIIVPDIPNEYGLASGNKGVYLRAEKSMTKLRIMQKF